MSLWCSISQSYPFKYIKQGAEKSYFCLLHFGDFDFTLEQEEEEFFLSMLAREPITFLKPIELGPTLQNSFNLIHQIVINFAAAISKVRGLALWHNQVFRISWMVKIYAVQIWHCSNQLINQFVASKFGTFQILSYSQKGFYRVVPPLAFRRQHRREKFRSFASKLSFPAFLLFLLLLSLSLFQTKWLD